MLWKRIENFLRMIEKKIFVVEGKMKKEKRKLFIIRMLNRM